jgi:hypothetical protein
VESLKDIVMDSSRRLLSIVCFVAIVDYTRDAHDSNERNGRCDRGWNQEDWLDQKEVVVTSPKVELERYDLLLTREECERAISALQYGIHEQAEAATMYRVS